MTTETRAAPDGGRLSGKRALVVGGAGSIGAAIVAKLLADGAAVVAADRNPESLSVLSEDLADARLSTTVIDIGDEGSARAGVLAAAELLGGLDIVVNATGVSRQCAFEDETLEGWNQVLAVNLTGAFLLAKVSADVLGRDSAYVVITSTGAERGAPMHLAYAVSKAGVKNLVKGLALALADRGIRVNAVGPGLMEFPVRNGAVQTERRVGRTDGIPLGRLGAGEDVASMVSFLVSDEASWVTGQNVYVDGGVLAR